jgi:hypothetical protein
MIAWYWLILAFCAGLFAGCLISARRAREAKDRADAYEQRRDQLGQACASLNLCGCVDETAVDQAVLSFLEWAGSDMETRPKYGQLFDGNEGVYCLVSGMIENAGWIEHGISIRHPWLTNAGEELIEALRESARTDQAKGERCGGLTD